MNTYKKYNNILGWATALAAFIVYLLTLEPTASWWDCGEYIATAYKLQVGHPPGAPLFQLLGRFFSLFAFGDTSKVAMMVNAMSAMTSAFTILFLFWSISHLARKIISPDESPRGNNIIIILGSALVGALAYTFSDSFWFSAVEGEVYAMSSFFTAIVFWAMLKWEQKADEPHSEKWIILIAYLVGLSIGVHLLNLLAIPAVAMIYYYKKYKPSFKGVVYTGIISIILLGFIMWGIIPDFVNLFAKTELLFVNSFGLPFSSGTLFFALLVISLLILGVVYTHSVQPSRLMKYIIPLLVIFVLLVLNGGSSAGNVFLRLIITAAIGGLAYYFRNKRELLNTVLLSLVFILIGYSSFLMIIIRSNANTPIDENSPEDAISLLSYLNREQYGDWPLFYGQYYNSPLDPDDPYSDGSPVYIKDRDKGKYVITDEKKSTIPNYDPDFITIFPRMWSNQKESHINSYKHWGKVKGKPIQHIGRDGESKIIQKPTFGENIRFFVNYQIGHMYWRYFLWNFVGRQNNVEGHGGIKNGNWISGIPFLDDARLGEQSNLPSDMQNPAQNKFYALPFLLGLLGLFYHLNKDSRNTFIVALLFIMTGFAIIVYLNQYPHQPRERDYAYAGSFYAFAIWIGIGALGVLDYVSKYIKSYPSSIITLLALLFLVPGIMAQQGWDDHDRSGKTAARDFAGNYLISCAPESILITNGDNDTFPLWYAQEVEGVRTDTRVVNYMLASGDWYVHQLGRKIYDSERLPLTLQPHQYNKGVNPLIPYYEQTGIKERIELKKVVDFIASERRETKAPIQGGEWINYFPTKRVKLTVDSAKVIENGIVPERYASQIVPSIEWNIRSNYLYKNDLMFLDFLATSDWTRPLYFANPSSVGDVFDVDKYCHLEGFVYRFMPVKAKHYVKGLGGILVDETYDILLNKCRWGNLNDPDVVVDRESYRNHLIPKQNFMRLAQALIDENRPDSAINVVDKYLEVMPKEKFHYDLYDLPFVEVYFSAGANEKAVLMAKGLVNSFDEKLSYVASLNPNLATYYQEEVRQAYAVLHRMVQLAGQYGQDELEAEFNEKLEFYLELLPY